jgi:hypothetical protein
MESRVGTAFAEISKKLSKEERESRMDIRYKRTGGINVIVELKRASVKIDTNKLMTQVDKYRAALREYLRSIGGLDAIETVCVIGSELTDWKDSESKTESVRVLATKNIRVVQYEQLLADAQASYRDYLDAQHDLGRIQELVMGLAAQVDEDDVNQAVSVIPPAAA